MPYDRFKKYCNLSGIVVAMVGFYIGNETICAMSVGMALVNLAHVIFEHVEENREDD